MMKLKDHFDFYCIVISRIEVESGKIDTTLSLLNKLFEDKETTKIFCERVSIAIDGYNDDSRELSDIPEVVKYIKALDVKFPYWFYFLNKRDSGLNMIRFCCTDYFRLSPVLVDFNKDSLEYFFNFHFMGLNYITEMLKMSREQNEILTDSVFNYFGMPN